MDAAALRCVTRLRFQPAARPGDAQPVDSWQRISLRWVAIAHAAAGATASSHAATGTTAVRVCADAAGVLAQDPVVTRSLADAARDAAALRIATAGSGNYRPASATGTAAVADCAQRAITFEMKWAGSRGADRAREALYRETQV